MSRKNLLLLMDQLHASLSSLPYSSRPPFEITGPVILDMYNAESPSAQLCAEGMVKRMLLYLNLPFVIPRVTIAYISDNSPEKAAGTFSGDKFHCNIQVNKRSYYKFWHVNAILAHECMHYFLTFHDLISPDEKENELLTDVSAVYVGFGEILLDGYAPIKTSQDTTHTIGYITIDEITELMQKRRRLGFSTAPKTNATETVDTTTTKFRQTRWKHTGTKIENTPEKIRTTLWRIGGILYLCFAIFGFRYALSFASDPSPSPFPTQKVHQPLSTAPPPMRQPSPVYNGQVFKSPDDECVAPFTVKSSGSDGYYVYLKSTSYEENDVSFYVVGGKNVEMDVPLDTYELWYCTGETWYGVKDKFGEKTKNYKADDLFTFYEADGYANGWTVTLYTVSNGNLDTEEVDEFPD